MLHLNKNVLRLQKYVLDMEEKALGKGFTLSPPDFRAFSYAKDNMVTYDVYDEREEDYGRQEEK